MTPTSYSDADRELGLRWWAAANYLTIAQIYLKSNPLLREYVPYLRVRELLHGRTEAARFHVRGFAEQGTTTTPFDMVVLNRMSRYHLVLEALRRSRRVPEQGAELAAFCRSQLTRHHAYVREYLEDMPEVATWTWQP
jgi:phosphoketolase